MARPVLLSLGLRAVFAKPVNGAHSPPPAMEQGGARKWLHYDNLADATFCSTHEIYCTVIDPQTALFLNGWYRDKIGKDAKWLDSRRRLKKCVMTPIVTGREGSTLVATGSSDRPQRQPLAAIRILGGY